MKKLFTFISALLCWAILILRLYLNLSHADSMLLEFIKFFSFMTIWTNIIVALAFTFQIFSTESKLGKIFSDPVIQGGILLYIIVVGIIYHLVLADLWNPQGLDKITDEFLHTVAPILYLSYWIFFVKKGGLKFINCIQWLVYPLVYIIYALIRGAVSGNYPYYFLDAGKIGYLVVFKNVFFVTVGYIVLGLIVILLDKLLSRKKSL